MIDPDAGLLVVAGIAILFATASWHKWRALGEFGAIVANYRLLPRWSVPLVSWLVPSLETGLVVGLAVERSRPVAVALAALLLLGYAIAIAINLRRARTDLDCGCAARHARRPIAGWMVVRNVLLAALLALAAPPWTARPLEPVDFVTLGLGIAIAALLYLAIDELLGRVVSRAAALGRPA